MKPVITAKVFVFNAHGQLLVLTRGNTAKFRPGGSDLPGGHMDGGETYGQTVVRETAEETGLKLELAQVQLVFVNTAMFDGHNVIRFLLSAHVSEVAPKVSLSDEHVAYRWLDPSEVDAALADSANTLLAYHYGLHNHLL